MLDVLQKAAKEAGEEILKHFRQGVKPSYKTSHKDILTAADLASQKIICKSITSQMMRKRVKKKEIGFISEENLNTQGKHTFIIDPIDGTSNFASGYNYFCVSIASVEDNKIKSGVIFHPSSNTLFFAEIGKGAYKLEDNKTIPLKLQKKKLQDSLISVIFNKDEKIFRKQINIYAKFFPFIRAIRVNESTALDQCKLTENVFSFHINGSAFIWDIAAGNLIVQEAGGQLFDWKGNKIFIEVNNPQKRYQFIACHPNLLHEILRFFD